MEMNEFHPDGKMPTTVLREGSQTDGNILCGSVYIEA